MTEARFNGRHVGVVAVALSLGFVLAPVVASASGAAPRTTTIQGTVKVSNFPAKQPVSGTVTATPGRPATPFAASNVASGNVVSETVPSGKTWVIQEVSVRAAITSGAQANAVLAWQTGGHGANLFLPMTYVFSDSGYDYYVASLPVSIYADAGSQVSFSAYPLTGSTSTTAINLSGYETN